MKKVLYISYDGMTDALGQSQVINYLIGLTKLGYSFDILSFEKIDKFNRQGAYIKELLSANNIKWYPIPFHSNPPLLSKVYDKFILIKKAVQLFKKNNYAFIHCRSYLGAEAGLFLQKKFAVKFIFDMRGFWPEEKVEANHWNQKKLIWRIIYKRYKKIEQKLLLNANEIVTLTNAAKNNILNRAYFKHDNITVIPCCTDTKKFVYVTPERRKLAKQSVSFNENDYVVGYLGSMGVLYMIPQLAVIFAKIKTIRPTAKLLVVSNTPPLKLMQELAKNNIFSNDVNIVSTNFLEVPKYVAAFDVSISLKSPTYGNIGTSPIKLGECLCSGIPVISNNGVGDVTEITKKLNGGYILNGFGKSDLDYFYKNYNNIELIDRALLSVNAAQFFGLENGVKTYLTIYKKLIQ